MILFFESKKKRKEKKRKENKTNKQTNKQVYVYVNKTRKEKLYKMSSIATPEQTSNAKGHKVPAAKMKANIRKISNKSNEVPVGSYQDKNDGGDNVVAVVGLGDVPEMSDKDMDELKKALSDDPDENDGRMKINKHK